MVGSIYLGIPLGTEVAEDPAEDDALMAWIGAKRTGDECDVDYVWTTYELKNAPTGKRVLCHFIRDRGSQWMLSGFKLRMDA